MPSKIGSSVIFSARLAAPVPAVNEIVFSPGRIVSQRLDGAIALRMFVVAPLRVSVKLFSPRLVFNVILSPVCKE